MVPFALGQPDRLGGIIPAKGVGCPVGDDRTGHQGGLIHQLGVRLGLAHPCVEVAKSLRFAVDDVVAELVNERGPLLL